MNPWNLQARTRAVHAGRDDLRERGVHALPLELSTAYPLGDLDEAVHTLDLWSTGARRAGNPIYARVFNETVARFEDAVAALEGTEDAVAFASGMAALSALLLTLTNDERRHVVAFAPLYGTTDHLLASRFNGIEVSWASADGVRAALRDDTACVIFETPKNPTLQLVDIEAVVGQVDPVPVVVDNTFATPVLQRPVVHGATFVLHSATKFIGGHGDAVGGVVATSEDWASALRRLRFATGSLLHPFAAYLLHRGIPTLPLRVEAAQATAAQLAIRLEDHPAVSRVLYPARDPRATDLVGGQMRGTGSLLGLELRNPADVNRFLTSLRVALHAVSLGTVDTLIEHPASMTHRILDEDGLVRGGISDGLVRISVGLEDPDDLYADITQALGS